MPQGSRLCLQLLPEPPPPPRPVEVTMDSFPLAQLVAAIERSGSNGLLSVELRDGIGCSLKAFERMGRELLKPEVVGQEIVCQKEIYGRGLSYRYFTKAAAAAVSSFIDAGDRARYGQASEEAAGRQAAGSAVAKAGLGSAGAGLTVQHEQRKEWVMELLQKETAADEIAVRVWIHVKHRLAGGTGGRIDKKTIRRCTEQLDSSEVTTFDIPRWPAPSEACVLQRDVSHHPLLTTHCSLPAARCPLSAAVCSLPAAHCPLLTARCPLHLPALPDHQEPPAAHFSPSGHNGGPNARSRRSASTHSWARPRRHRPSRLC